MSYKRVTISLPIDVLKSLDEAAKSVLNSRSAYIAEAVVLKEHLDAILLKQSNGEIKTEKILKLLTEQRFRKIYREASRMSWSEIQD